MKKLLLGFTAIFTLLLLSNCSSQKTVSPKEVSPNIEREWMLVEFQGFSKELMMSNKANLNLTKVQETARQFSANMGCNNMFGKATFTKNGKVKFSAVASTMMYCDKNMELESAFGRELPKITDYKIEGHYLTLTDLEGTKMKFLASDWD
jgi:heat shock protein HslJ